MPPFQVRLLTAGDEDQLEILCREVQDFTDDEGEEPLAPADARDYLQDPNVWHWHAEAAGDPVGFLMCLVQRRRYGAAKEVMLYEIGVRQAWRRHGVGRALMDALHEKMRQEGIHDVWVPADNPGAQAFYEACGYEVDELQGVMLSREV